MDVLIKGMKIPKSCEECWMTYEGDSDNCPVVNESVVKYMVEEKKHPSCPLIEVTLHRDWHTGQPTEEGWYLCAYGDNFYCANYWQGGTWKNQWGGTLLAYQKIEPYKEEK